MSVLGVAPGTIHSVHFRLLSWTEQQMLEDVAKILKDADTNDDSLSGAY